MPQIRRRALEVRQDLLRHVIGRALAPSARATASPSRRYASPSALISSRQNIPARRLASTISPATAFCSSLRQATVAKSADSLNRHSACRCNASNHPLRLRHVRQRQARFGAQPDGGIRLAPGREPDQPTEQRRRAHQPTAPSWAFCSTPFCSAQTTVFSSHRARSHPALSAFCVVLTASKNQVGGARDDARDR